MKKTEHNQTADVEPESTYRMSRTTHTTNGYDPRWIAVINTVLEDRETGIQITDILEGLWDEHIGPMIDAIEDDFQSPFTPPMVEFATEAAIQKAEAGQ